MLLAVACSAKQPANVRSNLTQDSSSQACAHQMGTRVSCVSMRNNEIACLLVVTIIVVLRGVEFLLVVLQRAPAG
jgi:hypothetical protein